MTTAQAQRSVESSHESRGKFRTGIAAILLLIAVGLTFWPAIGFDFVTWDDDINITQNPLLTDAWSWGWVKGIFGGGQTLRFEPLHWLVFRGLREVFGFSPVAWHVVNLTFHATAALLLLFVLQAVFALINPEMEPTRRNLAAFAGAMLWALHPLRAEVVGWATASAYSQTTLLLLGSFWAYLRAAGVRPGGPRQNLDVPLPHGAPRPARWLIVSWWLAVAAYASYPVGATYALWLLVADRWLLRPREDRLNPRFRTSFRPSLLRAVAFALPAGLAVGLTMLSRLATPGIFNSAPTLAEVSAPERILMALASLAYAAVRFVWPTHLTPDVPSLMLRSSTVAAIVGLAGAAALGLFAVWRVRHRYPGVALVAFGFVALAVPCLGWTERPVWPVDRYSYLIDLVLSGAAAAVLLAAFHAAARSVRIAIAAIAVLGFGTEALSAFRQLLIWRNTPALFAGIVARPSFESNPRQAAHVYIMWARYAAAHGERDLATRRIRQALAVGFPAIHAAAAAGDYRGALITLRELEPYFTLTPAMRREKAMWLLRAGYPAQARHELQLVLREVPDDAEARDLLNAAETALGNR